jgi:hypothetical protein
MVVTGAQYRLAVLFALAPQAPTTVVTPAFNGDDGMAGLAEHYPKSRW